jgi:hypothetical protein
MQTPAALSRERTRFGDVGGPSTGDVFRACNAGAHGHVDGASVDFVRAAEKLSRWLVTQ